MTRSIPPVPTPAEALASTRLLRAEAEAREQDAARAVCHAEDDCRSYGLRLNSDVIAAERKNKRDIWEMSHTLWNGVLAMSRNEKDGLGQDAREAAEKLAEADAAYRVARAERQHWERVYQTSADRLDENPETAHKPLVMKLEWLPMRSRRA